MQTVSFLSLHRNINCWNFFTLQEAEEAALAKENKLAAQAAAREAAAQAAAGNVVKSPSDFSCHSYELFVGQEKGNDDNNKEKMSIRSEGGDSLSEHRSRAGAGPNGKVRKVSAVSRQIIILFLSHCQ